MDGIADQGKGILPLGSGFAHRPRETPQLSIVIPAFNEAARIEPYLVAIREYVRGEYAGDCEVLVVDDGSRDGTTALVQKLAEAWPALRLIRHEANRGKGAAVRTGVAAARGRRILFADADGATPIEEERRLAIAVANGSEIAAASRYLAGPGVARDRNRRRETASLIFRILAKLLVGVGVKDTQCGFKMFQAGAGKALFELSQETGYLFDIEVLALAQRSGWSVKEVAVNWSEKPGSKVRFFRDSLRMFAGLWRLRRRLRSLPVATPIEKQRAA